MSVFAISDLHLSLDGSKSMEVFGPRWKNYISRIMSNWNSVVSEGDTVVIPGDISWGLTFDDALPDLRLLDGLPGTKIIGKGNHDFWWVSDAKFKKYFESYGINTIKILHNNAYSVEKYIICGSRGWFINEKAPETENKENNQKIINREAIRLSISLNEALKLKKANPSAEMIAFLHFPPVWAGAVTNEIVDVLKTFGIERCFFGHMHGVTCAPRSFEHDGIIYSLISSDFLGFCPIPV